MRTPRRLTAVAVLLATAFGGTLSALTTTADAAPDRADDRALARAADRYGVTVAELREVLRNDPHLRVSGPGLYYVDPAPAEAPEPSRLMAAGFPLEDTFDLHSRPGSTRTIYLDFDGQHVSGTWWNLSPSNLPAGSHPGWSLDGNAGAFNDAERTVVQEVFQRVAEDYAPFDVDVTTEDPGPAALVRSSAGDQVFGMRALITPSTSAANVLCGGGCGGIAFIDVFDSVEPDGMVQPAFVFSHKLGPDNAKFIADAVTHEVGHNLSLMHDGTSTAGYYPGHGAWGPIMGIPYDVPVTQWSLSDYPGAKLGGKQGDPSPPGPFQPDPDDIATITGKGGLSLRSDEAGSSTGGAAAVPAGPAYIHDRGDVDVFTLGTCSGHVTVTGTNAAVGPNLDLELQLLSSDGNAIDTDNPPVSFGSFDAADGLDATVSATGLASGEYYVRVDGVGGGNATTSYTDYGSVGEYRLQVAGCGGGTGTEVEVPSAPRDLTGDYVGDGIVLLGWNPPADDGGAPITAYHVYEDGILLGAIDKAAVGVQIKEVTPTVHEYGVAAVNSAGEGALAEVTVDAGGEPTGSKPGRPRIGRATPGAKGGAETAKVRWKPPTKAADPAIDGYQVRSFKKNSKGRFVRGITSSLRSAGARSVIFTSARGGTYKFAVRAHNALGFGPWSARSNAVRTR